MIGNYLRLPEADVKNFIADPETIMDFLYPADDSQFPSARHLSIEKSWQVIHFLLTGDPWNGEEPLCNAVLGGTEIGDVDVGYGPARFLTPVQVKAVSAALSNVSPESLWSHFDLQAIRNLEVYPHGWEGNDEEREVTQHYFSELKIFFEEAAKRNETIVIYLN